MTKKHLPTVEQIEEVEHILDEIEGFWRYLTKTFRAYSAKDDNGTFLVLPENVAKHLAENPNSKPLQLPCLDRRMLQLVKTIIQECEDAKSGRLDEVTTFMANTAATEKPSKERFAKAAAMVARGDLAAYDHADRLCMIRDEDVEDFERDHPEAKRIASPDDVEEFMKKKRMVA
jgi:hypothetical protein